MLQAVSKLFTCKNSKSPSHSDGAVTQSTTIPFYTSWKLRQREVQELKVSSPTACIPGAPTATVLSGLLHPLLPEAESRPLPKAVPTTAPAVGLVSTASQSSFRQPGAHVHNGNRCGWEIRTFRGSCGLP